jgi:hypothetical protein
MLHCQNAPCPDNISAGYLRRRLAHLRCLSELFLGFGELMQTGMGYPLNRQDLDQRIIVAGPRGLRIYCRERLRVHPLPKERFPLQDSEFPRPFRIRIAKPRAFLMSFFLSACQISMHESFVGVSKSSLWALPRTTGRPAGRQQEKESCKRYGFVCPLPVTPAPLVCPVDGQPNCISSMFSLK